MSNMIKFGKFSMSAAAYASQGNAILGIRDSGKSYTAIYMAECLMDAGIPILAFDPVGIWRFLRVAGKGPGYPVVVAGGEHGDLPLTPEAAPEIVRAAMAAGVSLVIDLYSMNLSKADWKRIVESCVRTLLYENKKHGLRHIFIEEAAEFCPQRVGPDQGKVYAEIEKLARMGGNAMLGYTMINQRGEEVNKAVLELCDGLFLHRQKGRNSLTALSKWLDIGTKAGGSKIIESLPTLPQGECWAWLAGTDKPFHVKIPTKKTFHPDRRAITQTDITAKGAVDVSVFVHTMKASLEKIVADADANDPDKLKKRIRELEKFYALAAIKSDDDIDFKAQLQTEYQRGYGEGEVNGRTQGYDEAIRMLGAKIDPLLRNLGSIIMRIASMSSDIKESLAGLLKDSHALENLTVTLPPRGVMEGASFGRAFWPKPEAAVKVEKPSAPRPQKQADMDKDPLLGAAIKVWPTRLTWDTLAAMCGRKARGGHFNTARKRLIGEGFVREEDGLVVLVTPPKNPERELAADLLEQNLPQPASKMFVLIRRQPGINKSDMALSLGMQPHGGHWNTGMSILRKNGLITEETGGGLYISATLVNQ